MSLDDVYRAFAGTPAPATCPEGVPPQTRMVEPLGHMGHVGHHERQAEQDEAGAAHEVETLLAALADAGRDLGPVLAHRLREMLAPLSRQVRAELVAVIDDAFEVAPDVEAARRQAYRLLGNAKALETAKAVWPAYPTPPAPTEAQAPARAALRPWPPGWRISRTTASWCRMTDVTCCTTWPPGPKPMPYAWPIATSRRGRLAPLLSPRPTAAPMPADGPLTRC